jgi:hypothetical protein
MATSSSWLSWWLSQGDVVSGIGHRSTTSVAPAVLGDGGEPGFACLGLRRYFFLTQGFLRGYSARVIWLFGLLVH